MGQASTAPAQPASSPWFRRLTFWSLLAGLCPLIPVPFLDDRVLAWVRRQQVAEGLRRWGLAPGGRAVEILVGGEDPRSALAGCLRLTLVLPLLKLAVYLVRKVFRKVVVVLLVKDCADRFAETFQEGLLLQRALASGWIDAAAVGGDGLRLAQLRWAVRETRLAVDPRPVERIARQLFRGSRRLLRQGARLLARLFRRRKEEPAGAGDLAGGGEGLGEEEGLFSSLLDRLTEALWGEKEYRVKLEATFDYMLSYLRPASPAPGVGEPEGGGDAPAGR